MVASNREVIILALELLVTLVFGLMVSEFDALSETQRKGVEFRRIASINVSRVWHGLLIVATIRLMISSTYSCTKFDHEDIAIALLIIATTIFYVGRYQRVRYRMILGVIAVVELVLIGLLWWALRDGIRPC